MSRQDLGRQSNRGCNNGRWHICTDEPEEPKEFDIWFDMNFLILKYYNGSSWIPFFGTGTGIVRKTSDEGVASTTTVQNDNELFIASMESNSIYRISAFVVARGTNTVDIKINWLLGGSAAMIAGRHCQGPATSNTNSNDTNMGSTQRGITAQQPYGIEDNLYASIKEDFLIQMTSSTGSIQMRWAQNASSSVRTTVTTDSYIVYYRVE